MPILTTPEYRCPVFFRGEHLETIVPNLSRRRFSIRYQRERLELSDGDFVDLDFTSSPSKVDSDTCLLVLHGLEGSSTAPYVKSLAFACRSRSVDIAALNFRGCSGELNRAPRFYHSGDTADLAEVIAYLEKRYKKIGLVGFSLGGNVALKYMGENPSAVSSQVGACVAISAPVDLEGSALKIGKPENRFYMSRFIRLLSLKIEAKAKLYPEDLDAVGVRKLADFKAFDGRYTAPLNGFESAEDYWRKSSALVSLENVSKPSLLINARNDPFLSENCFPNAIAEKSAYFYSAFPENGGHLGFPSGRTDGSAWHELVCLTFLDRFLGT